MTHVSTFYGLSEKGEINREFKPHETDCFSELFIVDVSIV